MLHIICNTIIKHNFDLKLLKIALNSFWLKTNILISYMSKTTKPKYLMFTCTMTCIHVYVVFFTHSFPLRFKFYTELTLSFNSKIYESRIIAWWTLLLAFSMRPPPPFTTLTNPYRPCRHQLSDQISIDVALMAGTDYLI